MSIETLPILWTGSYVAEPPPSKNNDLFPFMCFCIAFVHGMSFILTVYYPRDDGTEMIDKTAEEIDNIL